MRFGGCCLDRSFSDTDYLQMSWVVRTSNVEDRMNQLSRVIRTRGWAREVPILVRLSA